jgi:hypothetical protein
MADTEKIINERITTRGSGVIRIECWTDASTRRITRYNMSYANRFFSSRDNGRLIGFDNGHRYAGFPTNDHVHWFGRVTPNLRHRSFDLTLKRFERILAFFKFKHGRDF